MILVRLHACIIEGNISWWFIFIWSLSSVHPTLLQHWTKLLGNTNFNLLVEKCFQKFSQHLAKKKKKNQVWEIMSNILPTRTLHSEENDNTYLIFWNYQLHTTSVPTLFWTTQCRKKWMCFMTIIESDTSILLWLLFLKKHFKLFQFEC